MKRMIFLLIAVLTLPAFAQMKEDSIAIKKAALDYVVGWSKGDIERIQGAVSPELSKRRVASMGELVVVQDMSRSLLCASAMGNAGGVRMPDLTPGKDMIQEVKILDIEGTNSSVKTWNAKYGFFDYLHLSKAGGKWMVVNVLWDMSGKK
jgi:hypothetical protein